MSTDHDHDRHHENLASYALGALPDLERPGLERHLMACERCRDQLQVLETAAGALPRSVEPRTAPPGAKRALMATVRAESARTADARRSSRRRPLVLRPAAAWVAASAVLALAGFGAGVLVDSDNRETVSAAVDADRLGGASGSLVLEDGGEDGAVLRLNGLAPLSRKRVYQLWVQRGSEIAPAGVFIPGVDGSARAALPPLDGAEAVMVTRERAGGARSPTEDPVVTVDIA